MAKVNLEDASKDQLVAFAERMQLDFHGNMGADKLRALIKASGWGDEPIEVPDAESVKPRETSRPAANLAEATKVRIMIQQDEKNTDDVFVGVNDKDYLIKRGVEVEVPVEIYHVLNNAVRYAYAETENGLDEPIQTKAYPFNVLGFVA